MGCPGNADWSTERREFIPPFFMRGNYFEKGELSIFVDESGDYGFSLDKKQIEQSFSDCFYIVTLVFHEQNNCIDKQINFLENRLRQKFFIFYVYNMNEDFKMSVHRDTHFEFCYLKIYHPIFTSFFLGDCFG